MDKPTPIAAKFFYGIALVSGLLGLVVLIVALSGWTYADDAPFFLILIRGQGVAIGISLLVGSGVYAAIGAVIHDIRRIAWNTSPESLAGLVNSAVSRAQPRSDNEATSSAGADVTYYYTENGAEHGPVTRARIRELLRSRRLTPSQRIERDVSGLREICDPRDFGG